MSLFNDLSKRSNFLGHPVQISRCQNKTLCDDSSIRVLFKNVIYKWVGAPNVWEGKMENVGLNVENILFSGLKQGFFQFVSNTLGQITLRLSWPNCPPPPNLKKQQES